MPRKPAATPEKHVTNVYKTEWNKHNTTQFSIRLVNNTDAELIAHLKAIPNRQGYIKRLILEDMARQQSPD